MKGRAERATGRNRATMAIIRTSVKERVPVIELKTIRTMTAARTRAETIQVSRIEFLLS